MLLSPRSLLAALALAALALGGPPCAAAVCPKALEALQRVYGDTNFSGPSYPALKFFYYKTLKECRAACDKHPQCYHYTHLENGRVPVSARAHYRCYLFDAGAGAGAEGGLSFYGSVARFGVLANSGTCE